MDFGELFEDRGGRCRPDERLGFLVVRLDEALDGVFEIGDRFEDAATDFAAGDGREKSFDRVEPRRRSRGEMKCPSRMIGEPRQDSGVLVRGVVVSNGVNDFACRHVPLDGVEEANEFLMPMLLHAAPDDGSVSTDDIVIVIAVSAGATSLSLSE